MPISSCAYIIQPYHNIIIHIQGSIFAARAANPPEVAASATSAASAAGAASAARAAGAARATGAANAPYCPLKVMGTITLYWSMG